MTLDYVDRVLRLYLKNDIKLKNLEKQLDPRCNEQEHPLDGAHINWKADGQQLPKVYVLTT